MINITAQIITVITTINTVWIGACHGSFGEEKVTACSWEKEYNTLKAISCMTQGPFCKNYHQTTFPSAAPLHPQAHSAPQAPCFCAQPI